MTSPPWTPDQLARRANLADPYPVYRALRDRSPVRYVAAPAGGAGRLPAPLCAWGLLKYDDVYRALRDHETFSSALPTPGPFGPRIALLQDDPPRHTRFRRLVNDVFTPKRIEALAPVITSAATALLDALDEGTIDVVESYTVPLPVKVIARLLGIPGEDYLTFKRWSEALLSTVSSRRDERIQMVQEMVAYFGRMAVARRSRGADDLITALVEARIEGESLQDWEILGFCILLLIAGNETTTHLIGNLFNLLVDRPDVWRQLREDRRAVDAVIEETLRYESPVQRFFRTAVRDVEISGVEIARSDRVTIFYGSANRDPSAFPSPETFRLDRDLSHHVAFGTGIHSCLGAPLARAEARIALTALLDRFPTIRRGSGPAVRQTASPIVFGFSRLPLVLGT